MADSDVRKVGLAAHDQTATTVADDLRQVAAQVLSVLASLRLTVVLFALAIVLVFFGTLAQKDHDIWYVVDHAYFRVWFAHIELQTVERLVQMFRSVEWNLSGYFYFPGGKLIGSALMLNLLAAHSVRFKIAARGWRLATGLAIIAAGIVATYLVIQSGMNNAVESELSDRFCNWLWLAIHASLGVLALAAAYVLVMGYGRMRRVEWLLLLVVGVALFTLTMWLLVNSDARLDNSGLRILWQLVKGLAAGLILLVGCVLAFRKRAGVVLLHGGVALMMLGELLTGISAREAQMSITEGDTANYAEDVRTLELAVIDHSPADVDRVTVVPMDMLEGNVGSPAPLDNAELPVAVRVHWWAPSALLRDLAPGETSPATAGAGQRIVAAPAAPETSAGDQRALPAAYVELFSKASGESLGTYLIAPLLREQTVDVAGRPIGLKLRAKRIYFPYSLTLKDFRFDRYAGTNIAKNYSSLVRLQDPARNVDREVLIWMNNPLRYAGTTFYQSGFDRGTEQTTELQVVDNASWMIPYVACMLVLTGMLAHFGLALVQFARRRASEVPLAEGPAGDLSTAGRRGAPWTLDRYLSAVFPALIVVLAAGYLVSMARTPESPPSAMQIYEFGKLPLVYQGRVKPYDTVARNSLQILSGRQQVIVPPVHEEVGKEREELHGEMRLPAIQWLLDAISGAEAADDHRVFRIDNLELLQTLGLEERPGKFRYSVNELRGNLRELANQFQLAATQPEDQRSLYQEKVLQLGNKWNFYNVLIESFEPLSFLNAASAEREVASLKRSSAPHAVPPRTADGHWQILLEAEMESRLSRNADRPENPAAKTLSDMLDAYAKGDVAAFNRGLADYRALLAKYESGLRADADQAKQMGLAPAEVLSQKKIDFEVFYNHLSPFYHAAVLYVVAFVLGVLAWLGWTRPLRRASIWLLWFTFAVHTLALVGRIYISGRPPVTNLYSAAIFAGWGCVLLALVLESVYRLGLGNIVAAVVGFLTLLVAHFLSLDGDTFIVLQAVLDTQFWLATHVVTVVLGYSATYAAGTLGIAYVLFVHLFDLLDQDQRRQLVRMIYGTLCFAIFFSFIGTVLGGLWADDSWGRFWGWDPKENGALIIVLYNALLLHARWGGLVRERGLAALSIGGNIVTTWSLFGTNALGVGLHAYGASDTNTARWMLAFVATQVVLILLGMVPWRRSTDRCARGQ